MPRTIEHIVETHRLAAERRKAGKDVWAQSIAVKSILYRYDGQSITAEIAASVANEVASLLRSCLPKDKLSWKSNQADETLIEIVEGMEALKPDSYADDPSYSVEEDFNNMLDGLYDWADLNRVWLGL